MFFGLPLGAWLLAEDGHEVVLAVLSPVPAPGRRRLVRRVGEGRVIDAHGADSLDAVVDARMASLDADLLVSWFWTRRLPSRWLGATRLGGINVHPSLLPRHRGPDPYFWAIDAGDVRTGVTVHRLIEALDAGPILARQSLATAGRDAWQLARALDRPGLSLLRQVVRQLAAGPVAETAQDEAQATWAPAPEGAELGVDWRWTTERVLRRIRALAPDPGLAITLGGVPIFVTRAEAAPGFPEALEPGEAALGGLPERVVVRTGDGAVTLVRAVAGLDADRPPGAGLDGADLAGLVGRSGVVLDSATPEGDG